MNNYILLFPGQGSQSPGMLQELAAEFAVVGETFQQASDILGYDLWELAANGPEEKQRMTQFTQPLMYCSGVACFRVWQSTIDEPAKMMAGHSLGEFCALTAADSIDFDQGIKLVDQRARLMSNAVPDGEGGMAAILGMEDSAVVELCESMTGVRVVEAVNFNAPGQVAISGHSDALQSVVDVAKEHGARKAVMLPVSVPNHSSLMRGAGAELAEVIDSMEWREPAVPVMQNLNASVPAEIESMLKTLKQHVFSPVQWTRSVENMISEASPELFIELGPGKVLAGLGKRIDKSVPVKIVDSPANLQAAVASLESPVV